MLINENRRTITPNTITQTSHERHGISNRLFIRHLVQANNDATLKLQITGTLWVHQYLMTINHYRDFIMGMLASQITSLTIVYSTVYSDADQRKHQAPRHWPLWGEFTGDRWIPRRNGQIRGKCFHLMTSSCAESIFMSWRHGTSMI